MAKIIILFILLKKSNIQYYCLLHDFDWIIKKLTQSTFTEIFQWHLRTRSNTNARENERMYSEEGEKAITFVRGSH